MIELAAVAVFDLVEVGGAIRDQPREDVEAAGRALRIREGGDFALQPDDFGERNDIDPASFEHRPVAEIDLETLEVRIELSHLVQDLARRDPGRKLVSTGYA